MDKNTIRFITQNITPEEAEYVQGIKSTLDDTNANENNCNDIIFLTKLLSFQTKFKTLKWALTTQYQQNINEFMWRLDEYVENIFMIIQSIIGEVKGGDISKIKLPISDNPLDIINELKICLQNWIKCHEEDIEYKGGINATETFLSYVHKYIYIFRLCKVSANSYSETMELPNENTRVTIQPENVIQF
jgi:hypothetical protein